MIGVLRYRIALLEKTEAPDGAGGVVAAYFPVRTIWAGVELLSAVAAPIGERARRLRRLKALIRARDDIALGGRVRFHDGDYEIASIEFDDDAGRRLVLTCEEVL